MLWTFLATAWHIRVKRFSIRSWVYWVSFHKLSRESKVFSSKSLTSFSSSWSNFAQGSAIRDTWSKYSLPFSCSLVGIWKSWLTSSQYLNSSPGVCMPLSVPPPPPFLRDPESRFSKSRRTSLSFPLVDPDAMSGPYTSSTDYSRVAKGFEPNVYTTTTWFKLASVTSVGLVLIK